MVVQGRRKVLGIATLVITLATSTMSIADDHTKGSVNEIKIKSVVSASHRSESNIARDKYRHPFEVLKFFRIRDDIAVMEIWPGGGWWTEILAPFLSENGRYVAAHFPDEGGPPYYSRSLRTFKSMLSEDSNTYGKVEVTVLTSGADASAPAKSGSMDLALTFRNVHNWMSQGSAQEVFATIFESLKPSGYLGVVEHRASTNAPQDPKAKSGYVREDYAISLIEKAGFKLVAKSEVNANPKDTKDYPGGVWTLPPSYRAGDDEREKYSAIGESDRFTLLFQKPER